MTVAEIGVVCRLVRRRSAVTTISPNSSAADSSVFVDGVWPAAG
jgi:hypothetical protein